MEDGANSSDIVLDDQIQAQLVGAMHQIHMAHHLGALLHHTIVVPEPQPPLIVDHVLFFEAVLLAPDVIIGHAGVALDPMDSNVHKHCG
jgi:hypothetical protein